MKGRCDQKEELECEGDSCYCELREEDFSDEGKNWHCVHWVSSFANEKSIR